MSDDEFTFEDAMSLRGINSKSKPTLKLSGEDGNVFFIMGRAVRVLRNEGYTQEEIEQYEEESTSGDYDHWLMVLHKWFNVE